MLQNMKLLPPLLAAVVVLFHPAFASADPSDGWPRTFTNDGTGFTVYQPQVTEVARKAEPTGAVF